MKSQRAAQIKMTGYEKQLKVLDAEIGVQMGIQREQGCSEETWAAIATLRVKKAAVVQEMRALDAKCREQFRVGVRSPTLAYLDSPTRALMAANID